MNASNIQSRLERLLVEYNNLIDKWSKARAEFEKSDEMKKVTLNVCKNADLNSKTEAERERKAYCHVKYLAYLDDVFGKAIHFYSIDAKKKGIEQEIDVLRSLLSYEKANIDLHI